jgi:hypothetical protein
MARQKSSCRAALRLLPVALPVSLLVLGHLLSALHALIVPHTVCVAHGVATHETQHRAPKAAASAAPHGQTIATAHDSSDAHEHCLLCTQPKYVFLGDRQIGAVLIPVSDRAQEPGVRDVPVIATARLLLIAPKQSPPASS